MRALPVPFPHLDHFLNAYMHQDWKLSGERVEDVVRAYAKDNPPDDLRMLQEEINNFVHSKGMRVESEYHKLYANSVLPSGFGMTTERWLRHIADLVAAALPREPV